MGFPTKAKTAIKEILIMLFIFFILLCAAFWALSEEVWNHSTITEKDHISGKYETKP